MKKLFAVAASALLSLSAYAADNVNISAFAGEVSGTVMNIGNTTINLDYADAVNGSFVDAIEESQRAPYHLTLTPGQTATLSYVVNSYGDYCEFNFRNNGSIYHAGGPEQVAISAYSSDWWYVDCEVDAVGTLRAGNFGWEYDYDYDYDWDQWDWDSSEDCWFEDDLCLKAKAKAKA